MKSIQVFKLTAEELSQTKYSISKNGNMYTSNISKQLKDDYVARFRKLGYRIFKGCNEDNKVVV